MLTTVIYQNGYCGLVSTNHLDELIATGKIKQFLPLNGWATIGRNPLRVAAKVSPYHERRKQHTLSLDNFFDIIR